MFAWVEIDNIRAVNISGCWGLKAATLAAQPAVLLALWQCCTLLSLGCM